jgi:hypothetical protein
MRTFPVRTYSSTSTGSVRYAHSAQYGHCRSAYSTSVTLAAGSPRTAPAWGSPAKELADALLAGTDSPPEPTRLAAISEPERTTTAASRNASRRPPRSVLNATSFP